MSQRTLYHASSFDFSPVVGERITLVPGPQGAQGRGVYFSEGAPDVRASDSVHENGLRWIFEVAVFDATRSKNSPWWHSKGCRDRTKNRPRTWHTDGRSISLLVVSVDGNTIRCIADPL